MAEDPERFAVMLMPVPTDPACNPSIRSCGPEHADACAFARLRCGCGRRTGRDSRSLTDSYLSGTGRRRWRRWNAKPKRSWGAPLRDPREPDEEIERLIGIGVSLHKSVGSGLTPTLLMPRSYAAGHVPSREKLEEILEKEVGGREDRGRRAEGRGQRKWRLSALWIFFLGLEVSFRALCFEFAFYSRKRGWLRWTKYAHPTWLPRRVLRTRIRTPVV